MKQGTEEIQKMRGKKGPTLQATEVIAKVEVEDKGEWRPCNLLKRTGSWSRSKKEEEVEVCYASKLEDGENENCWKEIIRFSIHKKINQSGQSVS